MVRAANPFTPYMVGRKVRVNMQRDERIDIDSIGTLQAYAHDRTGNSIHFRFTGDAATSIIFLDKDIFTVEVVTD